MKKFELDTTDLAIIHEALTLYHNEISDCHRKLREPCIPLCKEVKLTKALLHRIKSEYLNRNETI